MRFEKDTSVSGRYLAKWGDYMRDEVDLLAEICLPVKAEFTDGEYSFFTLVKLLPDGSEAYCLCMRAKNHDIKARMLDYYTRHGHERDIAILFGATTSQVDGWFESHVDHLKIDGELISVYEDWASFYPAISPTCADRRRLEVYPAS